MYSGMDIKDRFYGCIFGQAVGDALGLGTEFMTREQVDGSYPHGLSDYGQIIQDHHRRRWKRGDWTDDTEMMLCIARAIIQDNGIRPSTIAENFKEWMDSARAMGIGNHTHTVLSVGDYVQHPVKTSQVVWNLSGKNAASNGGIMRSSVVGLLPTYDSKNAEITCMLTHYDPRCIGSCVLLSKIIHELVYYNVQVSLEDLYAIGNLYDKRIREHILYAYQADNCRSLGLDSPDTMGYTLLTLRAGLWAYFHAENFEEGLLDIINAGGDADTNAAVACSILGAKFGFENIPTKYITGLTRRDELSGIIDALWKATSRLSGWMS